MARNNMGYTNHRYNIERLHLLFATISHRCGMIRIQNVLLITPTQRQDIPSNAGNWTKDEYGRNCIILAYNEELVEIKCGCTKPAFIAYYVDDGVDSIATVQQVI